MCQISSLLITCDKLAVIKLDQAMRAHLDINGAKIELPLEIVNRLTSLDVGQKVLL